MKFIKTTSGHFINTFYITEVFGSKDELRHYVKCNISGKDFPSELCIVKDIEERKYLIYSIISYISKCGEGYMDLDIEIELYREKKHV